MKAPCWNALVLALPLFLTGAAPAPEPADRPETPAVWRITASNFRGLRSEEIEIGDLRDVTVQHDSLVVTAQSGRWNRKTEVAILSGDVRMTEKGMVVTCRHAEYDRFSEFAVLTGDVHAADTSFAAAADTAHVDRTNERVTLLSNATVLDSVGEIRADRIDYDRRSGIAVAQANVEAVDRETGSIVRGQRLVYNSESDLAVVTGNPNLTAPGEEQDTMRVYAEELRLDRRENRAEALRSVIIRQGNVQATAAHALLDEAEGWVRLTGQPEARDPDGWITADTLLVFFENREIRRLEAVGNVLVEESPSSGEKLGERIITSGKTATAYFTEGVVDSLTVEGDAVCDYYPAPPDLEAGTGVNHSRADRITLFMEAGRAARVRLVGTATGRYWFASEELEEDGAAETPPEGAPPDTLSGASGDTLSGQSGGALTTLPHGEAPPESAHAESSADTLQVLTLSTVLEPVPEEGAPADSAAADSLRWVERLRDLETVEPPDSLFPGGMDEVTYGGEVVEFLVAEDEIHLRDEATVRYHDATLSADKVVLRAREETVEATGSPVLSDPGGDLTGREMDYDIQTRKGVVYSGRTEFEGGYYYGRRIKKMADQTLLVDRGVYTTCDREDPHFHFLTPRLKIRLRQKVIGRPVIFHIGNVPVLAAPFFVFPIAKGRRSGFLMPELEVGISQTRGRFVRNLGYYWAASDYADATAWFDYYERSPRWLGYFQGRYKLRYVFDGQVYTSYALEMAERTRTPDERSATSRRWEFRARHSHQLSPSSSLKLDANFVSDKDYLLEQGIGTSVEEQVDRYLRSNLTFTKSWPQASLTAVMNRYQDLEATAGQVAVRSSLPSLSFSLNRRTVGRRAQGRDPGWLPWLSTVSYGYSLRAEQAVQDTAEGGTWREAALKHDASISDSRSLFGVLNVSPSFSYSEYLFEKDKQGQFWQTARNWGAGVSANTTLYGTWLGAIGPLVGFRHVMVPSVSFSYRPSNRSGTYYDIEDSTRKARFTPVGGISFGDSRRSRQLSMNIQNRFQAKLRSGEEVKKLDDLANLSLSASYNFEVDEKPLSPIRSSLLIRPHSAFNVDFSASHDPYAMSLTSLSVSSNLSLSGTTAGALPAGAEFASPGGLGGARSGLVSEEERAAPGQPWRLNLSHTYSRGEDGADYTSSLRGQLSFSLTPSWQISYSNNVNIREREIVSHNFSVYRDLHCWEARFERRFFGNRADYYFRISVKDIEEIFYERRSNP